jgi:hypothetical protein
MLDNAELEPLKLMLPHACCQQRCELMRRGFAAEGFKVANIGGQSENGDQSPVADKRQVPIARLLIVRLWRCAVST